MGHSATTNVSKDMKELLSLFRNKQKKNCEKVVATTLLLLYFTHNSLEVLLQVNHFAKHLAAQTFYILCLLKARGNFLRIKGAQTSKTYTIIKTCRNNSNKNGKF